MSQLRPLVRPLWVVLDLVLEQDELQGRAR